MESEVDEWRLVNHPRYVATDLVLCLEGRLEDQSELFRGVCSTERSGCELSDENNKDTWKLEEEEACLLPLNLRD